MGTKICYKCKIEKSIDKFSQNISKRDGLSSECKKCVFLYKRKYYRKNKENIALKRKQYCEQNKKIISNNKKKYYENNKEVIKIKAKAYRQLPKIKAKAKQYGKQYKKDNQKAIKIKAKIYNQIPEVKIAQKVYSEKYRKENKLAIQKKNKKYRENNKEVIKKRKRIYVRLPETKLLNNKRAKSRRDNELIYRLNGDIGSQIRKSLQGNKAGRHWENLVGYTLEQLKKHLEKQFKDGMSWDNRSEWHIDHIVPKSVFNFTKPEHRDFKRCWALKNLQPIWATDNLAKGAKIGKHFQPSLLI